MLRNGDCPNGCGWINRYSSCQDGSRELAAYEHSRECNGKD